MRTFSLSHGLVEVFGSWPNLTQGLIGSAIGSGLGVFGAYWVASHQMRHDRNVQRRMAGGQAASAILETVLPVRTELEALTNLNPDYDFDQNGIPSSRRRHWHQVRGAFDIALLLRSHLVPERVSTPLLALTPRLENDVLVDTWDDGGGLEACWPSDHAGTVLRELQAAQETLVAYARAALGDGV